MSGLESTWADVSTECYEASGGIHKDDLFNYMGVYDCYYNELNVPADRCFINWEIPSRCTDGEYRCLHNECVNENDLVILANEIYYEVQQRQCSLKSPSEQDCQCCCDDDLQVIVTCDWVTQTGVDEWDYGNSSKTIVAQSTIYIDPDTGNGDNLDMGLVIGLVAAIGLFVVFIGWFLIWWFSPKRKGYVKSDELAQQQQKQSGGAGETQQQQQTSSRTPVVSSYKSVMKNNKKTTPTKKKESEAGSVEIVTPTEIEMGSTTVSSKRSPETTTSLNTENQERKGRKQKRREKRKNKAKQEAQRELDALNSTDGTGMEDEIRNLELRGKPKEKKKKTKKDKSTTSTEEMGGGEDTAI